MTAYYFCHPVAPKPKERPRVGKRGRVYTPKTTRDYEQSLREYYDGPMFSGPVSVDLDFYKDRTVIYVENMEGLSVGDVSPLRGDIDNYIKSALDGLSGVAFENDKQVLLVRAEKIV